MPGGGSTNVFIAGDSAQHLVFADASTGAVLLTTTLTQGSLTAPPLIWNSTAHFGESSSSSTTLLHAYGLGTDGIADLWGTGLVAEGRIDATPVVSNSTVWFASNTGKLVGVGIANPASPRLLPPVDLLGLGSATATVTALVQATEEPIIVLVTERGLYAANVSGAAATLQWAALGGIDLTGVRPAVIGGTIFVAQAQTVYAVRQTLFGAETSWTYPTPSAVAALIPAGPRTLLVGCQNGDFFVLDTVASQSLAHFSLTLGTGAVAWTVLAGGGLLSLSPGGTLALNTFTIAPDGSVTTATPWTSSVSGGFAGPPAVAGELVYALSTSGALYACDPAAQKVLSDGLPLISSCGSSASVALGSVVRNASTARVGFLLDGENYFPTLRNVLLAALNKSFATPASLPSDLTFEGLVKAIAASGSNVYVMLWNASLLYALTDDAKNWTTFQLAKTLGASYFARLFNPNGAFRGDQRLNQQTYIALSGTPNVSVYLENYESRQSSWFEMPVELGSNHQKIIIASVAGTKVALVSGFNTITPSYNDGTAHTMLGANGTYNGESWHDTGLILTGSAVALVEAEFDRRWSKQGSAPAPSGDTYVKFSNWMVARTSVIDAPTTTSAYVNPLPTSPIVPTQVLITSNETFGPRTAGLANPGALLADVHQVLDQLIANIAAANSYIYLENFTFTSVELVMALAARLRANPPSGFQIIVMVPHPTVKEYTGGFSMELGQLQQTRLAYAALKLSSRDWSSYWLDTGDQISSTDTTLIHFDARGIEYTTLTFEKAGSGRTVPISSVVAITLNGAAPQVVMCSPARYFSSPPADSENALQGYSTHFRRIYIHSKLALIDDAKALVGSANFSQRSQRVDGELSVFVNDATQVLAMRQQLFRHWGMGAPSAWTADMASFAATTTDGVGVLPLLYGALPNQPVSWSWYFLTSVVDPSQLL